MNKPTWIIIGIVVILIALPVAWWLASPLFFDQMVDESFPLRAPADGGAAAMSEQEKQQVLIQFAEVAGEEQKAAPISDNARDAMEQTATVVTASIPDKAMDDPMPEADVDEWTIVATGEFKDADGIHKGAGVAAIYQQGDKRDLRFEDFSTTNGPDLHVLLVENIAAASSDELGSTIDLGQLKGNIGNQNYEIPAEIDLSNYSGVVIYCMPFHVIFSTASLNLVND